MCIKVMIVEDHCLARMGLRAILDRSEELQVIAEVDNGIDAVSKAVECQPDIILMDIGLPGIDGVQATREIKSKCPLVRVIALSTREDDADIRLMLSAGADGYCLKAISGDQLLTAIKSASNGAAWLHPGIAAKVLRSACASTSLANLQAETADNKHGLSRRELEVLQAIVDGCSNEEIANKLFISSETVKTHVRHIMEKLSVKDRTQAAVLALRCGLIAS